MSIVGCSVNDLHRHVPHETKLEDVACTKVPVYNH